MATRPTHSFLHVASALAVPVAGIVASIALAGAALLPNTAMAETPQTAPAATGKAAVNGIDLLVRATGLTQRQVRMVLGNRSVHAAYASGYDAADARFQQAVGPGMYARVKLDGGLSVTDARALAAMANARSAERTPSR